MILVTRDDVSKSVPPEIVNKVALQAFKWIEDGNTG